MRRQNCFVSVVFSSVLSFDNHNFTTLYIGLPRPNSWVGGARSVVARVWCSGWVIARRLVRRAVVECTGRPAHRPAIDWQYGTRASRGEPTQLKSRDQVRRPASTTAAARHCGLCRYVCRALVYLLSVSQCVLAQSLQLYLSAAGARLWYVRA